MSEHYESGSLSLTGAVPMGTGVMIGAGIFALTGQVAELVGPFFPLAFLAAAVASGFSAYSYIMMSRAYPSAGGILVIFAVERIFLSHHEYSEGVDPNYSNPREHDGWRTCVDMNH